MQSIMRRAFLIPELPLALTWLAMLVLCLLVLAVEKVAGQRVMHDKKVCHPLPCFNTVGELVEHVRQMC